MEDRKVKCINEVQCLECKTVMDVLFFDADEEVSLHKGKETVAFISGDKMELLYRCPNCKKVYDINNLNFKIRNAALRIKIRKPEPKHSENFIGPKDRSDDNSRN